MMFTNSLKLVRFILRRDRISLPIWLMSIIISTSLIPLMYDGMYSTEAEIQAATVLMDNPAIIAISGPGYGLVNNLYTIGTMTAHEMLLIMVIVTAIMNIFFVARHTRTDEELGRLELVHSLPVGSLSNLCSTLIVAVIMNVI